MIAAVCEHLWQSTLFAAVAWFATLALRDHRASVRHWIWFAASLKFLLPFSLLSFLGAAIELEPDAATREAVASAITLFAPLSTSTDDVALAQTDVSSVWALLLCCWVGGALALTLRSVGAWRYAQGALRAATPVDYAAPVPVKTTREPLPPGVFGVLRPVILLPHELEERLPPDQMRAIVAHELHHIERRDNLKAALHKVVETVLWFHPLVWWIGAHLLEERERACDEAVVAAGHLPECYADSMLRACRTLHQAPPFASAASGGDLTQRIEEILSARRPAELAPLHRAMLSMLALLTVAAPIAAGAMTAVDRRRPSHHAETLMLTASSATSNGAEQRIHLVTGNLRDLVALAYGVHVSQVRADWSWLNTRTYRLEVAASVEPSGYRKLLTQMLAERFNLQIYLNRACQEPCGRTRQEGASNLTAPIWSEQHPSPQVRF